MRQRARADAAPRLAQRLQAPRLDRIVRGRAWIPVLGATLVAIVGLRVEVLKLGASVGSEVQQATALQSSNAALRSQISALSDNARITGLAARYGMRMPLALDVHFLQASAGHHLGAAIRHISPPSRTAFLSALAAEEHSDQLTAQAGSNLSAVGAAPSTSTSLSSGAGSTSGTSTSTPLTTASASTGAGYSSAEASASGSAVSGSTSGAPIAGSTSGVTSAATSDGAGNAVSGSGASASGTAPSSPPGSSSSTSTGAAAGSGATNPGTDSSSSTAQTSGSTSGGTGLAG